MVDRRVARRRHSHQLLRSREHLGRGPAAPAGIRADAGRNRAAVQRFLLVLRHSAGAGGHGARPLRRHDREPDRRVPVGGGVGRRRPRQRLRHDLRGARPARRGRGAGVSGQFQGDRLLVPPRRALAGDRDLRRGGEVLQRDRGAAGGLRRRHVRLALGLRADGVAELRLLPGLLDHLSRPERGREAEPRGVELYPPGRRDARGRLRGQPVRDARLPAAQPQGVGAYHRFRRLRLFLLSLPHLAARLSGHGDAHEHPQVRRLRRDSLAFRDGLRPGRGRLADRHG